MLLFSIWPVQHHSIRLGVGVGNSASSSEYAIYWSHNHQRPQLKHEYVSQHLCDGIYTNCNFDRCGVHMGVPIGIPEAESSTGTGNMAPDIGKPTGCNAWLPGLHDGLPAEIRRCLQSVSGQRPHRRHRGYDAIEEAFHKRGDVFSDRRITNLIEKFSDGGRVIMDAGLSYMDGMHYNVL